jgi:NAD(P)H-dependent FMN reductase
MGTTRQGRFADQAAGWLMEVAGKRDDLSFELIDLRDYQLPFFDEPMPPAMAPSEKPEVETWRQKIAGYDGYVFVTAEYNNSVPAVLKNAIDHLYAEWVRKPAAFFGYGSAGGARSVQHLRQVVIELQMAPLRHGVNIMGGDFMAIMQGQKSVSDLDYLAPAAEEMLNQLAWWTQALKQAREA